MIKLDKIDMRYFIGVLVILFVIFLGYSTVSDYLVQYHTVSDVSQDNPAGMVWMNGTMQKNSLTSSNTGVYTFRVTDGISVINVSYSGELPSSLSTESDVVIFGNYDYNYNTGNSVFYAEKLTAKCPTKYQG